MDTQRADHLSSYGYHRPTSPRLDQFAAEGVLFEHAHANSAWTVPSHASLLTGRFVWEHRAGNPWRPFLDGRYATLAEVLRRAGYATGGFVANTLWAGRHTGLHRGFIHYEDFFSNLADMLSRPVLGCKVAWEVLPRFGFADIPGRKRSDEINQDLLEWLDTIHTVPFFAFLNYMDVHAPYLPPPPYAGMFSGNASTKLETKEIELLPGSRDGAGPSPEHIRRQIERYDESLRFLDAQIGALLDRLAQRSLLENTLIIVTSDHGESFWEHGRGGHGHSLYHEETLVPLILRYPKRLPAGVRVSRPVSLDRIPATVSELLGLCETLFPGRSLMHELDASNRHGGEAVLTELWRRHAPSSPPASRGWLKALITDRWHYIPSHLPASRGWLKALITDRWHYIVRQDGQVELYDIRADRQEVHNLASSVLFMETLSELRSQLDGILQARPAVGQSE